MKRGPAILGENFFNVLQWPGHVVSDPAGVGGSDPYKVGTSRRGPANVYTYGVDTNVQLDVALDRVRSLDTVVLDRNSNLPAGVEVEVRLYTSATDYQLVQGDLPASVVLGSSLEDAPHWIKTEEGAFVLSFPAVACDRVFLIFRTAGTGTANIGGVYAGLRWAPTWPRMPFEDDAWYGEHDTVRAGLPSSDWRTVQSFNLNAMLEGEEEYNAFRHHRRRLAEGHVAWIFPDTHQAERAFCGYVEGGGISAGFTERPQGRTAVMQFTEYDARLV